MEYNNYFFTDNIESFIDKFDIDIAEMEKVGAILLVLGYSNFYFGAQVDIDETLGINFYHDNPDLITLFAQELVLTGYVILFIVAMKRYWEKTIRVNGSNTNADLSPYMAIVNSYFLSVIANSVRLENFYTLAIDRTAELIE